jgi:hypothetical protein
MSIAKNLNYLEARVSTKDVLHSYKTAAISLWTRLEVYEATVTGRCSYRTAASSWISFDTCGAIGNVFLH